MESPSFGEGRIYQGLGHKNGINKGLGISRSLSSMDLAHDVIHPPDITQPLVMFERQS
jgi:hypothetical protein